MVEHWLPRLTILALETSDFFVVRISIYLSIYLTVYNMYARPASMLHSRVIERLKPDVEATQSSNRPLNTKSVVFRTVVPLAPAVDQRIRVHKGPTITRL